MVKLKKYGHNLTDIARRMQMNWRTVKKYLTSSIKRETRVNYNKYMNQVNHMINLEINPTAMFKSLKDLGMNCCERSFTRWFTIKFPAYQHKWNRACFQPSEIKKPGIWINYIPTLKKLAIFITNPVMAFHKRRASAQSKKKLWMKW